MTTSTDILTNDLPALSDETIDTLKALRKDDPDKFHALVAALRSRKWPLRAIADGLGVSRSIVAVWEKKGKEFPNPKVEVLAQDMPKDLPRKVRPVYSSYKLSEEQQKELRDLTEKASTVRRFTDPNAPSRIAAAELEQLLHKHRDNGASLADLARACKVSRRAVAQRLEKIKWQEA